MATILYSAQNNYCYMYHFHTSDQKVKPVHNILYCTGSGMLTRYMHCGQCNIKNIALTTVYISHYSIPKSPKKSSDSFNATLDCMFVYIKY